MKNLKIVALVALGIMASNQLQAQNVTQVNLPNVLIQKNLTASGIPANVEGSPYLNETFNYGKILVDGSESYQALLRYNGYQDQVEIKNVDNSITVLMKSDNIEADFNDTRMAVRNYDYSGTVQSGYFIVVAKVGDFELLERKKINLRQAQEATSSYATDKPARFEEDFSYYLRHKTQNAQQIRLKAKPLIDALPEEYQEKAKKATKANKWKLKEEKEVISLLNELAS